jgi:hypothetical protein
MIVSLLFVLAVMVVVLCAFGGMGYMGGCLDARSRWPTTVSCDVRINFLLILRNCRPQRCLRPNGRWWLFVDIQSRSRRLSSSFAVGFRRLILLTTFTYPTIEAVFTIACGLGADELNEFIAFEGRGVAS